jgi:hypothetical protein
MPLSDRERRLLAEMEAALATDDPRLESRLSAPQLAPTRSRILIGVALILAGIAVLFTGLVAKVTLVGVAGFLIALAGVITLVRAIASPAIKAPRSPKSGSSLSSRIEDRWNRRTFE